MQGSQLIPFVAHANNFVSVSNRIRLDTVPKVIEKPLLLRSFLSLGISRNNENQRAMSVLFRNILEDKLLTGKVSHRDRNTIPRATEGEDNTKGQSGRGR